MPDIHPSIGDHISIRIEGEESDPRIETYTATITSKVNEGYEITLRGTPNFKATIRYVDYEWDHSTKRWIRKSETSSRTAEKPAVSVHLSDATGANLPRAAG